LFLPPQESRQRNQGKDDPAEELDDRVERPQVEKTDDDEESVRFEARKGVLEPLRQESMRIFDPSRGGMGSG